MHSPPELPSTILCRLFGNHIGPEGAKALAPAIASHRSLSSIGKGGLDLSENSLGDEGWGAIISAVCRSTVSRISSIDASGRDLEVGRKKQLDSLSYRSLIALATTPDRRAALLLQWAWVSHVNKKAREAARLAPVHLHAIRPAGAKMIAQALHAGVNRSLTECNVSSNQLDSESAKMLANIGLEKGIMLFGIKRDQKEANFCNKSLGPADAILIASDLANSSITSLNLERNHLGPEGAKALAPAIAANRWLSSIGKGGLDLRGNRLGDEGWGAIIGAVCGSTVSKISSIDASDQGIGVAGGKLIAEALRTSVNRSLSSIAKGGLDLRGNRLGNEGWGAIVSAVCDSSTVSKISSIDGSEPSLAKLIMDALRTRTFRGRTLLTAIALPAFTMRIEDEFFRGCSSLTSIALPDSVTSIGDGAFDGCSSMTSITLPASLMSIGVNAFGGCSSLTSIIVAQTESSLIVDVDGEPTPYFPPLSPRRATSAPMNSPLLHSLGSIGYEHRLSSATRQWSQETSNAACANDTSSTPRQRMRASVWPIAPPNELPTVTSISRGAFSGCSSLSSIILPGSVRSIGYGAFEYCSSLSSIALPDSVTSIDDGAFRDCSSLVSITLTSSVTSIGKGAFANCSSLTSMNLPASVESIRDGAFHGCSSLTSISLLGCVTIIGDGAFYGCSSLPSITLPDCVTIIGDCAFRDCSSLTSITIPNSVTIIGDGAFRDCSSLNWITIPDSVTSIGVGAFSGCSSLAFSSALQALLGVLSRALGVCLKKV